MCVCVQEPPLHAAPTGCRAGCLVTLLTSSNQAIPVKLKVSQVEDTKGNTLHVVEDYVKILVQLL